MLSIVISSYQPQLYAALEKNIAETCGLHYEMVKMENPGLMGICEAYNKGAAKANFENLLFLHEDVKFHTINWGAKLINHLHETDTGIVGVAGSDYVPVAPCGWHVSSMQHQFLYLIQNNKEGTAAVRDNFVNQPKHPVLALDGVFLAMKKEIYDELKFDENLRGFHAYDLDISLRSAKKYKNYVIGDILLEHFSLGNMDKQWLGATIAVRKKLGSTFQKEKDPEIEKKMFLAFLEKYLKFNGFTFGNIFSTLRFFPYNSLPPKMIFEVVKKMYYYLRYKDSYNSKYLHNA